MNSFNNLNNVIFSDQLDEMNEEKKSIEVDDMVNNSNKCIDFYSIFTKRLYYSENIPRKCMKMVIKSYCYLLKNVLKHNTNKSWIELC